MTEPTTDAAANYDGARLETRLRRLARLDHASTFLEWSRRVTMPPGGAEPRAEALAELAEFRHELAADADIGDWLEAADAALAREGVPEDVVPSGERNDPATRRASLREMRRARLDADAGAEGNDGACGEHGGPEGIPVTESAFLTDCPVDGGFGRPDTVEVLFGADETDPGAADC